MRRLPESSISRAAALSGGESANSDAESPASAPTHRTGFPIAAGPIGTRWRRWFGTRRLLDRARHVEHSPRHQADLAGNPAHPFIGGAPAGSAAVLTDLSSYSQTFPAWIVQAEFPAYTRTAPASPDLGHACARLREPSGGLAQRTVRNPCATFRWMKPEGNGCAGLGSGAVSDGIGRSSTSNSLDEDMRESSPGSGGLAPLIQINQAEQCHV